MVMHGHVECQNRLPVKLLPIRLAPDIPLLESLEELLPKFKHWRIQELVMSSAGLAPMFHDHVLANPSLALLYPGPRDPNLMREDGPCLRAWHPESIITFNNSSCVAIDPHLDLGDKIENSQLQRLNFCSMLHHPKLFAQLF